MAAGFEIDATFVLPSIFIVMFASLFIRAGGGPLKVYVGSLVSWAVEELRQAPTVKPSPKSPKPDQLAAAPEKGPKPTDLEELQRLKELYFKLHNLERHQDILPESRKLLLSMFAETLADAQRQPRAPILSVESYTPEKLERFLCSQRDLSAELWEEYLARRKAGAPRENFRDRAEARRWLRQHAPVKYVDGAWLGHINKITTPFALRRVTKDAWQVLSEELGDGDAEKNHVEVYRSLMKQIGADLPDGDDADFIHPRHELDELYVWKAAVAQLLVSLFPHEFLPEILGFNLHFEEITQETLKATRELKEVRLNAYYFVLHISIDNADSGHTAIAMQTVMNYIDQARRSHGDDAAQQAWRRVQAGYILSEQLSSDGGPKARADAGPESFPRNEHEAKVTQILRSKAAAAGKIHCSSRMKLGSRTLVDWLKPGALASKAHQMEFMDHLSKLTPWIRKGDSDNSKLIHELSWRGKMFGSFTQSEVEAVRRWIDTMGIPDPQVYWSFVGRTDAAQDPFSRPRDISVDYPVFLPVDAVEEPLAPTTSANSSPPSLDSPIAVAPVPEASGLLPLWFAHPCLLEGFVSVPYRTTTKTASSVVRFLRAQSGFDVEGPGVAGMDEVRRTECPGLVELGLEMAKGYGSPAFASLHEVLRRWPSDFALRMLHWSMRPVANAEFLLGLAWAFVGLHDVIAVSSLLSANSRGILRELARRERESLNICLAEIGADEQRYSDFRSGFCVAKAEIEACCGEKTSSRG